MDPAAGLGFRHTLYPVHAALIFQHRVRALAVDHEVHRLHAANAGLIHFHGFHLPAAAFRIVHIHPVKLCRKQGSLVSACTRTDLHDNVLVIVGVLGQQQDLQLRLQLLDALLGIRQFLF